jgi:predicted nucleic acid-binding protein
VIIPDINLLAYAYNSDAPFHHEAKSWWESCLTRPGVIGLPWAVTLGFVRIMSSNAVLIYPMAPVEAIRCVKSWLACVQTQIVVLGPRHLQIFSDILRDIAHLGPTHHRRSSRGSGDRNTGRAALQRRRLHALSGPSLEKSVEKRPLTRSFHLSNVTLLFHDPSKVNG